VMIRMQAVHTGVRAIEADAELRSTVMSLLGGMTVDQINQLVSGAPKDRAEELLANIASQARTPELRAKASTLLHQIRHARAGG
jgi:hypothetical protein